MTRAEKTASLAKWRRIESWNRDQWKKARRGTPARARYFARLKQAKAMVARRQKQIDASAPLAARALKEARALVGVMESGGNNRGPKVTEIIRTNGGTGPEPWCGDFVAYCYRRAGSKLVSRSWASVYFLGRIAGLERTYNPQPGDIVRFTFSHTGLFVRDLGGGYIETIEGNTGASGAVSDSSTGGDGVYVKRRAKNLVLDYREVKS